MINTLLSYLPSAELMQLIGIGLAIIVALLLFTFFLPIRRFVLRVSGFSLALVVWLLWIAGMHYASETQKPGNQFKSIEVFSAAPDFVVGSQVLMQNPKLSGSASEVHVAFSRNADDKWVVGNVSTTRNLSLRYKAVSEADDDDREVGFNSNRFILRKGDQLYEAGSTSSQPLARVTDISERGIGFRIEPWDYNIAIVAGKVQISRPELGSDGVLRELPLPICAERTWYQKAKDGIDSLADQIDFFTDSDGPQRVAYLGGERPCNSRLGFSIALRGDLPFAAASLHYVPHFGFALIQEGDRELSVLRNGRYHPLSSVQQPLDRDALDGSRFRLSSFIAGYTSYKIEEGELGSNLAFSIMPNRALQRLTYFQGLCAGGKPNLAGEFGQNVVVRCEASPLAVEDWATAPKLSRLPGQLALAAAVISMVTILFAIAAFSLPGRLRNFMKKKWDSDLVQDQSQLRVSAPERIVRAAAASSGIGFAVYAFLYYYREPTGIETIPQNPYPAIEVWLLAAAAVAWARGARILDGVVFAIFTAIVALGHVSLTALSLQMEETRYLRFANDTSLAVMVSAGAFIVVSQIAPNHLANWMKSLSVSKRKRTGFTGNPVPMGFILLLCGIALMLVLWALLGTETGIAGFLQPSEVVKALFVLALAVSMSLALDNIGSGNPGLFQKQLVLQGLSGRRFWSVFFILVAGALLAAIYDFNLYLVSGASAAIFILFLCLYSPFWRSFALISIAIGVMMLVPVTRSDMSPVIIVLSTAILSFALAVSIHYLAAISDKSLLSSTGRRRTFPETLRPAPEKPGIPERVVFWTKLRTRQILPALMHPLIWMLAVPVAIIVAISFVANAALSDANASRQTLVPYVGGQFTVPVERVISWIEFNGAPSPGEGRVAIEFADTALQVDQSRKTIVEARCDQFTDVYETQQQGWWRFSKWPFTLLNNSEKLATDTFLGSRCQAFAGTDAAVERAKRIPAIQSDFIATWLTAYYGRDGAVVIAFLQWVFVGLIVLSGFMVMRWTPGQLTVRPAATTAGYGCLAFGIMLALQWLISWANGLGVVPVMGQPATFLAHGRSHFLFFGLPSILFVVSALRMRSAYDFAGFSKRFSPAQATPIVPLRFSLASNRRISP